MVPGFLLLVTFPDINEYLLGTLHGMAKVPLVDWDISLHGYDYPYIHRHVQVDEQCLNKEEEMVDFHPLRYLTSENSDAGLVHNKNTHQCHHKVQVVESEQGLLFLTGFEYH